MTADRWPCDLFCNIVVVTILYCRGVS